MALTVDRYVPLTPEQVLATIRTRAAYWQESRVPPELRSRGMFGIDAAIEGSRFELKLQDLGRDPPASPYRLVGTVTAEADGSRIRARVTRLSGARWGGALVAVFGLWLLVAGASAGDHVGGAAILIVGGLLAWMDRRREETLTREDDRGVAHLLDRLDDALGGASSPGAVQRNAESDGR